MRVVRFASLLHSGIRLLSLAGSVGLAACSADLSTAQAVNQLQHALTGWSYTTLYCVYMTFTEGLSFKIWDLESMCRLSILYSSNSKLLLKHE